MEKYLIEFLYLILKYYLGGYGTCTTVFITHTRYKYCPIPIDSHGTVNRVLFDCDLKEFVGSLQLARY